MGIANLWHILSSESDERLAFPVFLSRFIEKHNRFPRLAIDAYMFMFWSQLPGAENDVNIHRRILRNFMAKLWYLVQHNVLFVVVFDGKFKPEKLRNGYIPEIAGSTSYEELLRFFKKIHLSNYSEGLSLVETLKRILQRNCIDYVQAPGEAEAECAWLQRLGVVDFVVSDDSDTLVFGATQMLRLFNRVKYKNENGDDVLSSTDYYVNPVYMDRITDRTGLDKERLVLVAVLRGGDYSTGAQNVGITRASEIALCGSTMLLHSPRKALQDFGSMPDFSKMFSETFLEQEKRHAVLTDPYFSLKPELDRSDSLKAFNEYLAKFLRLNAKDVFGRMADMKGNLTVDDYFSLLYFFPLVNSKIFKFTPFSVSYSDLSADDNDLVNVNVDVSVARYNYVCSATDIGQLVIENGIHTFIGSGRGENLQSEKYPLPRERKFNLKSFALKLLADSKYADVIQISRTKLLDGTTLAVLTFQRQQLNEAVYLTKNKQVAIEKDNPEIGEDEDEADDPNSLVVDFEEEDDKLISVAVPLESVRLVAPKAVEEFERIQVYKRSPKKKVSPQKTTLDLIWHTMLPGGSPTKQSLPKSPVKLQSLPKSPLKLDTGLKLESQSPTKLRNSKDPFNLESPTRSSPPKNEFSRRRKSYKNTLLPGQSQVTSFFQPKGTVDPFQDAIFVPSDEDDEVEPSNYMQMKSVLTQGPIFSQPTKAKVESRLSSPELSPSKRSKNKLSFSPNTSPLKPKREDQNAYPPR